MRAFGKSLIACVLLAGVACLSTARVARGEVPSRDADVAATVTHADVEALLAALAEAHRREDVAALVGLYDTPLRPLMDRLMRRMFQDRNYFRLETRVLAERTQGDVVDVEVIQVLRSRRVAEGADRREKARWVYSIARRDSALRIVSSHAAPLAPLPAMSPWEPLSFTGKIVLRPASGRPEGEADIRVNLVIQNVSSAPQAQVALLLHPFATGLEIRHGETLLEAERTEGALDTWVVTLPEPLPAGGHIELSFAHAISEIGFGPDSSIGPDGARLLPASCWLPVLRPPHRDRLMRATHDLVVETSPELTAVLPGRLESVTELAGGRRAWRWVSQHPGGDLLLLAGRFRRESVKVSERVTLEIFRPGEAPARIPQSSDPGLVARALSMTRFLESFAPSPVASFSIVEGATTDLVSAPELIAIPDFEERWGRDQEKETQPFFFLAHHLAHAWVVDGAAPTGRGSGYVAEGLCDHLATVWTGLEVDAELPRIYRGSILGGIGSADNVDRPLIGSLDDVPYPDVFGSGKALLVFDAFRALAGDAEWRPRISAWLTGAPGRDIAALPEVLGSGASVLEAYCQSFFFRQGFAEVRLVGVNMRDLTPAEAEQAGVDPDVWHRCDVTVRNVGLGPAPVRVVAEINGVEEVRDIVAGDSPITISYEVMGAPRSVRVDPARVLWTTTSNDDYWPARPPKPRHDLGQVKSSDGPGPADEAVSPFRDALPAKPHR